MNSVFNWMGQRVTEVERAAYQNGLDDAVKILLASNLAKSNESQIRVALKELAAQILDSKQGRKQ